MGAEHLGKIFRSGNSVALRLPKDLGFREGEQVRLVQDEPGKVRVETVPLPRRTIDVDAFWGKAPGLKLAAREDFEERPSARLRREQSGK